MSAAYRVFVVVCWVAAIVYATIPSYWLLVHPFIGYWRDRGARLSRVGPLWLLLWLIAGIASYPLVFRFVYRSPLPWIPGGTLVLTAFSIYYGARPDFTTDQVLGRAELEPHKHEQRLVTTGLRGRMRHPLYLAHLCELVGLTIGTGSLALYALLGFAIPTGALMIAMEERELESRFGEAYREYKRRVPAILPRL